MNNPNSDEDQTADPATLMGWRTRVNKLILRHALENKTRLTVSRQPCFVSVRPATHGACSFLVFGGVAKVVQPPRALKYADPQPYVGYFQKSGESGLRRVFLRAGDA